MTAHSSRFATWPTSTRPRSRASPAARPRASARACHASSNDFVRTSTMPDDEQFERELADRLRSYAASGDRPVDPRVVVVRATSPQGRGSGGGSRFTSILGAAAGILVVLVTLS